MNRRPQFSKQQAAQLAQTHYGLTAVSTHPLPSDRDQNFLLHTDNGQRYVLKLAQAGEEETVLQLQQAVLAHLHEQWPARWPDEPVPLPRIRPSTGGDYLVQVKGENGRFHHMHLLTYLPGTPLGKLDQQPPALPRQIGRLMAQVDTLLLTFDHPAARRELVWDLAQAPAVIARHQHRISDPARRALLAACLADYEKLVAPHLPHLRRSIIHGDANDYNLLVEPINHREHGERRAKQKTLRPSRPLRLEKTGSETNVALTGLIDFGDVVYSATVYELAIAAAYALLDKDDPLTAVCTVTAGYHEILPLTKTEISLLFPLIRLRLGQSVAMSAYQQTREPDNDYLTISQRPAWAALTKLAAIAPALFEATLLDVCGLKRWNAEIHGDDAELRGEKRGGAVEATSFLRESTSAALSTSPRVLRESPRNPSPRNLVDKRQQYLGPMLSLSYAEPLHIVRGEGQYLYDAAERPYLDMVNNVAHVGHSHPHVVEALTQQARLLNTNTRYLHETILAYAERLTATLPDPLRVCFFVNSGSEANDLALRLARAHTGRRDMLVVDGAYHGNLTSLIEISPYKFNGPGGQGAPDHVHVCPMPDPYRGQFGADGAAYAQEAAETIETMAQQGQKPAAFICESLLSCGGQIVLPDGYLTAVYAAVRAAGGVTIADEVQVGFGRVGSHFWGFELQGVVPDIVTMGKPMGNGHPLAAVVTTPEIAASFNTGMEYFNTYGGNPVSCAVGTAVLNVLEAEGLQAHAAEIGRYLLDQLTPLKEEFPLIGDVRGRGLFLGIELVRNRQTKEAAASEARAIVEHMKEAGILLSTDGPLHNVIKIKPPLPFNRKDADYFLERLTTVLHIF
jgi:4-aminobutyrate aminotransferase-like enzyme/Ser/Thr protein kinase RdoA (MazF antagonist)